LKLREEKEGRGREISIFLVPRPINFFEGENHCAVLI